MDEEKVIEMVTGLCFETVRRVREEPVDSEIWPAGDVAQAVDTFVTDKSPGDVLEFMVKLSDALKCDENTRTWRTFCQFTGRYPQLSRKLRPALDLAGQAKRVLGEFGDW